MSQGDLRFGVLVLTDAPFATLFKRWERDGQGAFQRAGHASCGDLRQRADGTRTPAGAAWNPGELVHVDPELEVSIRMLIDRSPAHQFRIEDLEPQAAASQEYRDRHPVSAT